MVAASSSSADLKTDSGFVKPLKHQYDLNLNKVARLPWEIKRNVLMPMLGDKLISMPALYIDDIYPHARAVPRSIAKRPPETPHNPDEKYVAYTLDGSRIARVLHSNPTVVEVCNKSTRHKTELRCGQEVYNSLFSPSGDVLATQLRDTVVITDLVTKKVMTRLYLGKPVARHFFSPDGSRLAVHYNDYTVTIWDTGSWNQKITVPNLSHYDNIELSQTGKNLIVEPLWCGKGPKIHQLFDLENRTQRSFESSRFWLCPKEQHAVMCSNNRTYIVHLATNKIVASLPGHAWKASFDAQGKQAALAIGSRAYFLGELGNEPRILDHGATIRLVTVSPDGTQVTTSGEDNKINIWRDVAHATDEQLMLIHFLDAKKEALKAKERGLARIVHSLRRQTVNNLLKKIAQERMIGHAKLLEIFESFSEEKKKDLRDIYRLKRP